jgi:hypothetical protein
MQSSASPDFVVKAVERLPSLALRRSYCCGEEGVEILASACPASLAC